MKRFRTHALLSAAALASFVAAAPALAQDTPDETVTVDVNVPQDGQIDPMAMLLPMLNLKPAPAPDPARLAVAERVLVKVIPTGAMRTMVNNIYATYVQPMMARGDHFPASRVASISGLSTEEVEELPKSTQEDVMAILDPQWRDREARKTERALSAIGKMMDLVEPVMRDVIARAYARKFSVKELTDIEAFFSTPTGTAYAGYTLEMIADPYLLSDMILSAAKLKDKGPEITAAMAGLKDEEPTPKVSDLSDADRARLADLLGVEPGDLHDPVPVVLTIEKLENLETAEDGEEM